ncbi:MAG TPA: NADP-dependent phosphogluconate dehydrogenase [Bellilinea sp.]|jgi:6-phosphogluconate dehydrogenase|nr:NADP-dependent phosphogluconate dehydrogenase [Bellilinea sp.]
MTQADFGVFGLGVMGFNIGRNIQRNGFIVAAYNRSPEKVTAFVEGAAPGPQAIGVHSFAELVKVLKRPRKILLMIPAGTPVDNAIAELKSLLEPGDMLIDGGNSYFLDTERRSTALEGTGIAYVGMGVSGGEEGALWGPSLMPGGPQLAWEALQPIWKAIAAKAEDGEACVTHIGPRGAGHYVKMVHNGIEYGDMQLIAEAYDVLHRVGGLNTAELQRVFSEWNQGELTSYLIEITAKVLGKMDEETGKPLVDLILDEAAQKGTGKWTSQNSLDIGAPVPTIDAAVNSRILSSLKEERVTAAKIIHGPVPAFQGDRSKLVQAVRDSLYASKIISYAQGMAMLRKASQEYQYDLNLGEIAKIWRAGCIIRAELLNDITAAYNRNADLENLLLDEAFRVAVESRQEAMRYVVTTAIQAGVPVLATSASLAYFDAYRSATLPANLIQAQRDFFGAHTYRRVDREGVFHTQWEK